MKVLFTEAFALCGLSHMVASLVLVAKRALVKVLLSVAALYAVVLSFNREASQL